LSEAFSNGIDQWEPSAPAVLESGAIRECEEHVSRAALPVGGAAVNYAFIEHFRDAAHSHFTLRRLGRLYGKEANRSEIRPDRQSALKIGVARKHPRRLTLIGQ